MDNSGKTLLGRDLLTLKVQDDTDTMRGWPLYWQVKRVESLR